MMHYGKEIHDYRYFFLSIRRCSRLRICITHRSSPASVADGEAGGRLAKRRAMRTHTYRYYVVVPCLSLSNLKRLFAF